MMTDECSHPHAVAWAKYQRMRVRLTGRINRELARETGLSEADFEILMALLESADETVRALALRCGLEWEKSRLSHQLRRMEERGLVSREECVEDNRGSVVRITSRGREVAEEAKHHYAALIRRYVSDILTEDQMSALGEIADAILTNLGDPKHV